MKTIVVGSGKGGVGKSTVCVNIAVALAQQGYRVGLIDADIYGPSIPMMMGLRRLSPRTIAGDDGREIVIPFQKFGVHCMSIGFFVDEAQSVLWRGPVLHTALQKMVRAVEWGELDYLLIDLPPGTGDVPISLSQLLKIDGAIIVTTPQEVALADVLKAINSFDQLQIPLLGIVVNMTGDIFGASNGDSLAQRLDTAHLGSIPLDAIICRCGDEGTPYAYHHLNTPFHTLIQQIEVPCTN